MSSDQLTIALGVLTPARARTSLSAPAAPRVFELDLLRGVAILLVVGSHAPARRGESGLLLRPIDLFLHQFGWTGVDLFFVLSGYLIGGLLFSEIQRTGNLDISRFLIRRMFRIWPAYYLLLGYVFFRDTADQGAAHAWAEIWPCLVHLQNYRGAPRTQLWSLAVEEHFYLLLPLCLWALARRRACGWPGIFTICAALTIASLVLRYYAYETDPSAEPFQTHLRLDSLFFGVALAHLNVFQPSRLRSLAERRGVLAFAMLLLIPAALKGVVRNTVGLTGLFAGYGLMLVALVHRRRDDSWLERCLNLRPTRWLARIGTSSYSIYLFHRDTFSWQADRLVQSACDRLGLPGPIAWLFHSVAYVTLAVAGGIFLDRVIEKPVLKLREHLFPPNQPGANGDHGARTRPRLPAPRME